MTTSQALTEDPGDGAVVEASCAHSGVRLLWFGHGGNWYPFAEPGGDSGTPLPSLNPDDWDSLHEPVLIAGPRAVIVDGAIVRSPRLDPMTRTMLETRVQAAFDSAGFKHWLRNDVLVDLYRDVVHRMEPVIAQIDENAHDRGYRDGYRTGKDHAGPGSSLEAPDGESPEPLESTRRFYLRRFHENSPKSAGGGTGIIAVGTEFPDKTVALRWLTGGGSTAVWPNVQLVIATHCHEDSPTEIWWLD